MKLLIVHIWDRLYDDYDAFAPMDPPGANMPSCHGKPPNAARVTRILNGLCRQRSRGS